MRISTFFRQLLFDILYVVEFVILLTFGLLAAVKEFDDNNSHQIIIAVIVSLWELAKFSRILYYTTMHVWSKTIRSEKRPIRKELEGKQMTSNQNNGMKAIQKNFFQYVFISRNTWICGSLNHIQTTLIILPKAIIEAITDQGKDVQNEIRNTMDEKPKWRKILCPLFVLLSMLFAIFFIFLLLLSIPILVFLFFWNLTARNGFKILSDDIVDGKPIKKILVFLFGIIIFHLSSRQTVVAT